MHGRTVTHAVAGLARVNSLFVAAIYRDSLDLEDQQVVLVHHASLGYLYPTQHSLAGPGGHEVKSVGKILGMQCARHGQSVLVG